MRKITFFLTIIILAGMLNLEIYAAMSADDKKVAREMWLKGFGTYDKAKKNSETGNYKESLKQFQDALILFEKIKKLYPDWNKALIDYRINVCRSKIVEVKADMQKNQLQGSQMELDVENMKLKQRVKELEKELKDTRNQLDITFASLDVARREAARNDKVIKQVNDLLREKINLTNKCAMLQSQLDELKKQKSTSEPSPEKEEELKQALLQLEAIKKDRDELLSTIEFQKKKFEQLVEERNDLSLRLQSMQNSDNSAKQKQADLENEIKRMQEVTSQLQKDKEEILAKMNELRKKQADKEIMIEKLKMELEKKRSEAPSSDNLALDKLAKDKELLMVSLENANEKISSQDKQIKALKAKIALAENKITTLSNTLAGIDSKRSGLESDMQILTKKLVEYEKIIKEQKERLKKQSTDYKNLKKDFELYSKTVRNSEGDGQDTSSLVEKLAASEKEKEELKSELETVNSDYSKLQEELQAMRDKLAAANKTIEAANAEIKELENGAAALDAYSNNDEVDKLKEKNTKLTVALDALKITNSELVTKVNSLNDKIEALNKDIEQKEALLDKAQKICEMKLKESASNNPPSPKESQEYMALLNENDQLKALAQEQKKQIAENRKKIEALESELDAKKQALESFREASENKKDITENPEYVQLMKEKKKVEASVLKLSEANKSLKESLAELQSEMDEKNKIIAGLQEEIKNTEPVNVKLTPEYTALLGKNKVLTRLLDDQKEVIRKLKTQIEPLKSELEEKQAKIEKLKKLAGEKKDYNIEDDPEYKKLLEEKKQLKLALDGKNNEIKNIKETVSELRNELKTRENEIAALKSAGTEKADIKNSPEYIALMNENDQLQTMLDDKTQEVDSLKKSIEDLETENAELVNIKHSFETEKAKKEAEEAEKQKALEEISKLLDAASEAEKEGKTDAAIWYYETILEQDHENPAALAKLGLIKASAGNFDDAEPLLKKAVEKDPKNLEALLALTFCYLNKKQYFQALSAAALANSVNPHNATVHRYMGIICSYLGWYDVAETEFRKAFRINPKSGETAYNAAVNLIKADISKIKVAKQWYDKSIELGVEKDPVLEKLFEKKLKELKENEKKKHSVKRRKKHKTSKKLKKRSN